MVDEESKNSRLKRFTDKDIVEALTASGGLIEIAARYLGCSPSLIYKRRDKSRKVAAVIASEREYSIDMAERNLRHGLQSGEQWATVHALRYLGAKRGYMEKQQVEHAGSVEITLKWDEGNDADADDTPSGDAPGAGADIPPSGTL